MKIIRWLLSHSLFILLIVAVIYAYMFWGNLLGKDTPAGKAVAYLSNEFVEVEEFVNAIKAKQAQLSEEKSSDQDSSRSEMAETANTSDSDKAPQQIVSIESAPIEPESIATEEVVVEAKTEVASTPVVSQPVIEQPHIESIKPESIEPESIAAEEVVVEHKTEVASAPVDEQQPVIISQSQKEVPQNEKPSKQNTVATIDSKDEHKQVNEAALADSRQSTTVGKTQLASDNADVAVSAPAAMAMTQRGTEGAYVSAEVAKQLDNVDDHGEVIDASQPSGAVRENWITARKSFYRRNYELSEQSYQQVIDSTKNNYDAYGELGNVYFNQGKNKQAASAYFEAAAILVSKGEFYRVRSLMGLLRYLDKAKANELQQLIASTKS